MGAETIGLLIVVGVIVAVLALYLITIGLALTRLNKTLGSIVAGLTLIRDRTVPVGEVLDGIVAEVDAIEENLDGLLGAVGSEPARPAMVSSVGAAEGSDTVESDGAEGDTVDERVFAGTSGTNVTATTRTPRPRGVAPRARPMRTSRRSRARALEEAASDASSKRSGRRAGKRKQLALTAGSAGDDAEV